MAKILDLKSFIARHRKNVGKSAPSEIAYERDEIDQLLNMAYDLFMKQPMLLEVKPPLTVVGDIHGQYPDLCRIFTMAEWPPAGSYLFLGDYVDRGPMGLECICLLLAFKLQYPGRFFLLRGNHETASINRIYGFLNECTRRFDTRLWIQFQDVFRVMPLAARISKRIFCMHGGLSERLTDFEQINQIERPLEVREPCLAQDLLWADPDFATTGYVPSTRGVSKVFGADVVAEFCERMKVDLVARAHQVVQDGFQLFAEKRLITIFSAPNYCGEFNNNGAVMFVDKNMKTKLRCLAPII